MIRQINSLLCSVLLVTTLNVANTQEGTATQDDGGLERDDRIELIYKGQKEEQFELKKKRFETAYKDKEVPATCTREVPDGEREVCRDVTLSRQVCHTVPESESCSDVPYQDCTNVTRYRTECLPGPSREECHTTPSREVCSPGASREECHTTSSRQVCTTGPSRRDCHNEPSRRVCRTRNGREVCRDVPGRRVCRDVPGKETCRTVPGERVCRDVRGPDVCRTVRGERMCRDVRGPDICNDIPYQDTVCTTEYRNECHTIPEHEECEDVPYQDTVCSIEPTYRTEEYACTQTIKVPYQKLVKDYQYEVEVNFVNKEEHTSDIKMLFAITKEGELKLKHKAVNEGEEYFLNIKKEEVSSDETDEVIVKKKIRVLISLNDLEVFNTFIKEKGEIKSLTKKFLKLEIGKTLKNDKYLIHLQIIRRNDGKFFFNGDVKQDAVAARELDENKNEVRINLNKLGLEMKPATYFFGVSGYRIEMKVKSEKLSKLDQRKQFTKILSKKLRLE